MVFLLRLQQLLLLLLFLETLILSDGVYGDATTWTALVSGVERRDAFCTDYPFHFYSVHVDPSAVALSVFVVGGHDFFVSHTLSLPTGAQYDWSVEGSSSLMNGLLLTSSSVPPFSSNTTYTLSVRHSMTFEESFEYEFSYSISVVIIDEKSPVPGGGGLLNASVIPDGTVVLSLVPPWDDTTPPEAIHYEVYAQKVETVDDLLRMNMSTVHGLRRGLDDETENMIKVGVSDVRYDSAKKTTELLMGGDLEYDETYIVNVVAVDRDENAACYHPKEVVLSLSLSTPQIMASVLLYVFTPILSGCIATCAAVALVMVVSGRRRNHGGGGAGGSRVQYQPLRRNSPISFI